MNLPVMLTFCSTPGGATRSLGSRSLDPEMRENSTSPGYVERGRPSRRLFLLLETLEEELEAEWSRLDPTGAESLQDEPGHRLVLLQRWLGLERHYTTDDVVITADDGGTYVLETPSPAEGLSVPAEQAVPR